MRPKGKLFALLAVFMAIGVVAATGAFTTVSAERTATVSVSGDSNALIGLSAGADNPSYVSTTGDQVEITLADVNLDATTDVNRVLNITNNGGTNVYVTIHRSGDNPSAVSFYKAESGTPQAVNITNGTISSQSNTVQVDSGTTLQVSMEIDTVGMGLSANDGLIDTIEIEATDVNTTS